MHTACRLLKKYDSLLVCAISGDNVCYNGEKKYSECALLYHYILFVPCNIRFRLYSKNYDLQLKKNFSKGSIIKYKQAHLTDRNIGLPNIEFFCCYVIIERARCAYVTVVTTELTLIIWFSRRESLFIPLACYTYMCIKQQHIVA